MARHIMVDLETLGLAPDSVILSIGAVLFDETGIQGEGHWALSLHQPGRHTDLSTIKWWMQQSDAARAIFNQRDGLFSLSNALDELGQQFDAETRFWSNGANFDEVLLADACQQLNRPRPWNYKYVRCYRTVRAMFPDVKIEDVGTKHNALDDARYQASVLIEACKTKGLVLP